MDAISQAFSEAYSRLTAPGSPWELTETIIEGRSYRAFRNAPTGMREIFAPGRSHGAREFLVYEGERWSFDGLFGLADALGNALHRGAGVAPGQRVAIAMRNYPEWMAAFIAIGSIGAVAVPLNSWGRAEELEYGLRDCGARHVLCDSQRLSLLAGRLGEIGIEAIVARHDGSALPAGATRLEDVIAPWQGMPLPEVPVSLDDPALMLYTSGTTGKPKGALSTQRALGQAAFCFECSAYATAMANPETIAAMMQSGFEPAVLLAYPLFHVSGLHATFLSALRAGRRIVMMYKWDAERALECIQAERITSFSGSPSMVLELLEHPRFGDYDTSSLNSLGAGGSATPAKATRLMFERVRNPMPGTGWGMTETNAIGSSFAGKGFLHRMGSSGFVQPIVELRILDEEGEEMPPGVPGMIWVKSISLVSGYWNRPDANAKEFRDGWFNSGDIGYLDADGYLFLTDRAKDMVIRGGENVYPLEIESTLMNHPDVVEVVAFGVPDEKMGEEVALVVRRLASSQIGESDVRSWLGERLAPFKVPRYIHFTADPLPRNAMQKVLKKDIRTAFVAGMSGSTG